MTFIRRMATGMAVAGLMALFAASARADLLPTFTSVTALGANDFQYIYTVNLTANSMLVTNQSLVTVYDFQGLIPGSESIEAGTVGTWTSSEQASGVTPPTQAPPDNPTLTNVTFTYAGPSDYTNSTNSAQAVLAFNLRSTNGAFGGGLFTPFSAFSNSVAGVPQSNTTFLEGPNAGTVPEPGTLAMLLGSGFGGSLMLLRRRRA